MTDISPLCKCRPSRSCLQHLRCLVGLALFCSTTLGSERVDSEATTLKALRSLGVDVRELGDRSLEAVIPFNDGRGGGWDDADFSACFPLLKRLERLSRLQIDLTKLGDASMERIGELRQLRHLQMMCVSNVTDVGIAKLKPLTNLQQLDVTNCQKLRGATLAELKTLPLRRLNLNSTFVGDKAVNQLESFERLEELILAGTDASDISLAHLAKLPRLKVLNLTQVRKITDEGVERLESAPALETLYMAGNPLITDRSVESLARFPKLRHVALGGTRISKMSVGELKLLRPDIEIK